MSKLDGKRIDHLYRLLQEKEKSDLDAAASLRWAIFTLEQMNRDKSKQQNELAQKTALLAQYSMKPEQEINDIMDTGAFNEIVKGYLVMAMQATGSSHEEIQQTLSALEYAFDDADADKARQAYQKL